MITEKHTFSRGVLVIEFMPDREDIEYGVQLNDAKFYVLNGSYEDTVDDNQVTVIDRTNSAGIITVKTCIVKFAGNEDRLVRWELMYVADENYNAPQCVQTTDEGYRIQGYAADITNYELSVLKNANLSCDCSVPNALKCDILRIFVLRAAERTNSPKLKTIFKRMISLTSSQHRTHSSGTGGCGCHG